jgi:hypothetical protein
MIRTLTLCTTLTCLLASGQALAHGNHAHGLPHNAKPADASSNLAKGTVFLDKNRNGIQDRGERGIRGVPVSNGIDVVTTDAHGQYRIALPAESILFISKPAEYDVPVDENNLPKFYYIHYPEGTPAVAEWKYDVIAPTGPLPARIDFPLLQAKKQTRFKAMVFADPQAKTEEEQDMVREEVVNELIGNPFGALFGMTAGDVVYDTLSLYERHNAMFGKIGIPMWNVPGNHDINYESPNHKYATQSFSKYFGPTYYSFNYGDVHVVALNNVQYKGAGQGRYDNTVYRGYVSEEQIAWLKNDLQHVDRDKLIVIITHIPLITYALDGKGQRYAMGDNINTVNLDQLIDILKPFDKVYAIAGHDTSNSWKVEVNHTHGWYGTPWIAHTLAETRGNGWNNGPRGENGARAATMQDGNPNGYYVMGFDGTDVKPRFVPAGQKGNLNNTMRIVLDPLLQGANDAEGNIVTLNRGRLQAGSKIVVNLFDGGERDSVKLSLNNGAFAAMTNVLRTDPFMERQYERYRGTPDAFSRPEISSHIWEFELPADLTPGTHTVVVKAVDEFGQRSQQAFSFELTE